MLTLYDHPLSGNCHKVRLLLSMLGLEYTTVYVDVLGRENRTSDFLAINPLGQVPVLVDGDTIVCDSQAILYYLATSKPGGQAWLPTADASTAAHVVQWLAFAALEIASSFQLARVERMLPGHVEGVLLSDAQVRGMRMLHVLDGHLAKQHWLAGDLPSIADLACVPYVAMAVEGALPLEDFTQVTRWIERIAALPGYISMPGMRGMASVSSFGDEADVRAWVDAEVTRLGHTRLATFREQSQKEHHA
jgi:glutathione S-transferase